MTSRSLCFKLMREDLKRRIWTTALSVLSLVFTLLVPVALKSSSYLEDLKEGISDYGKGAAVRDLVNLLGINGMVVAVLLILAVVWAVSGFHYLHNSRQVDFYHSIPVKRHVLFLASYFDGLLVPAAVYLVVQALSVALVLRTGIALNFVGALPWKMFLLNMLYYAMIYTTAVIAMMMTGNMVIALLGTGVFLGWGPAVTMLIVGYRGTWFHTLCETAKESRMWENILSYSSPFANYMYALGRFNGKSLTGLWIVGAAAVTVALGILACMLYRIRPSEAAGRAMAFGKTRTPIKLLIALPVAVVFGIFFYDLRSTLAWGIFGCLCGSFLTCCLMEIIYHFDFRKLLANWIHLAACGAASVLLLLAGIYDWYGYDSYLPKATDVKTASVTMGYSEEWVTYGEAKVREDYQGRKKYAWVYDSQSEYQHENMELTDIYTVMELAKKGVEAEKNQRSRSDAWVNNRYSSEFFIIQFRLNNGREVTRKYRIPLVTEEIGELKAAIHDSKEYKTGTYPILGQSAADTSSVYFQQYSQVKEVKAEGEERARLLAVYQKDLEDLTMETRKHEIPIGTIQFRTLSQDQAIAFNRESENSRYEGIEERCYYPVYPSFTRTLEALREMGTLVEELNGEMISAINVQYYGVYDEDNMTAEEMERSIAAYEGREIAYDDREDIDALCEALVFRDYQSMNAYYEASYAESADVTVIFASPRRDEYEQQTRTRMSCQIDLNKMSEETARKYGFFRYAQIEAEVAVDTMTNHSAD